MTQAKIIKNENQNVTVYFVGSSEKCMHTEQPQDQPASGSEFLNTQFMLFIAICFVSLVNCKTLIL